MARHRREREADPGTGDCDLALDIDVAEHLGGTSFLYANTRLGEPVVVQRAARDGGRRLAVAIPAARAYAFDAEGFRLR